MKTYTRMRQARRFRYREALLAYYGSECFYCGINFSRSNPSRLATLDHVIPVSQGGANLMENLVMACFNCNNTRGDMPFEDFMEITMSRMDAEALEMLMFRRELFDDFPAYQQRRLEQFKKMADEAQRRRFDRYVREGRLVML